MRRIYLDNSATSFPKAPGMADAIYDYLKNGAVNINRTESNEAFSVFDRIYTLRENLSSIYNYPHPECVIFTRNVTEALNWIIKGLFNKNDHIIVSSNEHNAVMRPLLQMDIDISRIPSDNHGFNDYSTLESMIKKNTKAIILNAAGNVSGAIQDLEWPARIAKNHNLMLFIDSAQASPFVDIDMEKLSLSGVAFTGHKGFLGPQGTGGMILRKDIALKIPPLISGGTGSESDKETIPATLPDRLSPGTENIPGLVGLAHSVEYVIKNRENLLSKTKNICSKLIEGLMNIDGIEIVGADKDERRSSVISIISNKIDIAMLSHQLLLRSGIESRVGLHCSPSSHKVLGTFPTGTLRLSPGPFTTEEEIDIVLRTIKEILNE